MLDDAQLWDETIFRFAEYLHAGIEATDERVLEAVADHRRWVSRSRRCDSALQRTIADTYVADPVLRATIDRRAPRLAEFVRRAVHHHADTVSPRAPLLVA